MGHVDHRKPGDEVTSRVSSLPVLGKCPGFFVMNRMTPRDGSKAADTGSAVGRIIELWHRMGEDPIAFEAACRQAGSEMQESYPRADWEAAKNTAYRYGCDDRNHGVVVADYCEIEIDLHLDPAPEDPTGETIVLRGHIDQLRQDKAGRKRIWDIKNGQPSGLELLFGYAWQLAAYSLAMTEHLGETVLPGGIIRTQAYGQTKKDVSEMNTVHAFFEAPWSVEACERMMANVAQHIAWLRLGIVHCNPGIHCTWCRAQGPHQCGPMLSQLGAKGLNI